MKKLMYSCFAMVLIVSGSCAIAQVAPAPEQKQIIGKGKVLTSPQMRLLNMVLEDNPNAVVRTKITCAKAAKAIKEVNDIQQARANDKTKKSFTTDADERAFISGHLRLAVDPVKQFFAIVRDHKSKVTPVIAESLGITTKDIQKSWLLKFFETPDDVATFFDREIKTIEDLKSACIELIVVFSDVNESLSDRARKACADAIKKMQEAQKQAAQK